MPQKRPRGDREIVMTALSQHGWALQYATEALRGDREIVMAAVSQNGLGSAICHRRAERRS